MIGAAAFGSRGAEDFPRCRRKRRVRELREGSVVECVEDAEEEVVVAGQKSRDSVLEAERSVEDEWAAREKFESSLGGLGEDSSECRRALFIGCLIIETMLEVWLEIDEVVPVVSRRPMAVGVVWATAVKDILRRGCR